MRETLNVRRFSVKNCLTIAGSDCSGGAGIQADLKTFSALGCYGMSVITSVVAENTEKVITSMTVPPEMISAQLEAVFSDITVDAVKIGMLPDVGTMRAVQSAILKYHPEIVVCDPIIAATAGTELMQSSALGAFVNGMIPLCSLLTPNIPEAEQLLGCKINDFTDIKAAALSLFAHGAEAVLIKGGHLSGDATDLLFDGREFHTYTHPRIDTRSTHGTGCTLSSAITALLAQGKPLPEAVALAKEYLTGAIEHGLDIGHGHGPTNHFYRQFPE